MPTRVVLTRDAARDLEELFDYLHDHDSPYAAVHVLERIEAAFVSLSENPQRGAYPPELLDLGIREYRQVFFKPYRIVYRVTGETVAVMLITDGRRDLQSLLQRRLLEG